MKGLQAREKKDFTKENKKKVSRFIREYHKKNKGVPEIQDSKSDSFSFDYVINLWFLRVYLAGYGSGLGNNLI